MKLRPLIMGILNVTPDSFSDGGLYFESKDAIEHGKLLAEQGADIIDIGGESTRPGSKAVSHHEEAERVLPVVESLARSTQVPISIDTRHYEVAEAAVKLGATIINDVSGGADIRMASLVKDHELTIVLMHMQGNPQTMQKSPHYPRGVVAQVSDFLASRVRVFSEIGIPKENLWVDPGFGFGKTLEHNLQLLYGLEGLLEIGGRLVVGTSRKSFLSRVVGEDNLAFEHREPGTLATNLWAYQKGASVFRVHQVEGLKRALQTWEAVVASQP